ncbi:MAG: metallophosphoesterase family protein [Lentisphaeria bacterium]|nr:metallophosphoesterase family protein [Lentisphaeria bacterium]
MRLAFHCERSNFVRPFPERARRWRPVDVPEPPPLRAAKGLKLRRFTIPAPAEELRGRRIAFLSDLHYHGSAAEERRIDARATELTAGRVDLLLLGGDITGDACDLPGMIRALRRLAKCAPRALAVPGNWERGKHWLGVDFWRDIYAQGGVELLCNEYRRAGGFGVYGEDDLIHGVPEPPSRLPADGASRILLTHRPDAVIADDDGRLNTFFLALCGHTHGGQWRLPGLGALYVPSLYGRRFDRGWFRGDGPGPRMFVTVGAGELSLRGRFNCPREAAVIELA